VATGTLIVVLDQGTRELRGFDAATGRARFVLLARGTGPGEFQRPAMLVALPNGFAILDHATSRVTAFDAAGRARWNVPIPLALQASGVCVAPQARVVVSYRRRDSSVVTLDSSGRVVQREQVPWRVARPTTLDFAHEAAMAGPLATGRCVVAPLFGSEWALVAAGPEAPTVHRYIEPGPEPVVTSSRRVLNRTSEHVVIEQTNASQTPTVAYGVLVRGDTIIVQAAMTRRAPRRILDYYDGRSGRYLHSRILPVLATSLAIDASGTFFATRIGDEHQELIAMRPVRAPEGR
jgi:hypothetical protein